MKKLLTTLPALALATLISHSEIPQGYYDRLNGKSGAELKQAAFEIVNPHLEISSYSDLPRYFQQTDVYPDSHRWWDMYSDIERFAPSFSGLNREHAFPKSWWGGLTTVPAYIDLNHLYPADGPANQAKSNYPLGEVIKANPKFDNQVSLIGYPVSGQGGGATYVFEPDDEYKGDFARTYFYMVTCYVNLTWNKSYSWMMAQNDYPTLTPWAISLLLKWHRDDPVSVKETARNEVVFGYQNNRNPFIDYPELAEYIWGDKVGTPFDTGSSSNPPGEAILTAPVAETTLEFPATAVGQTSKAMLFFKGSNLTSDLSLSLGGADREMFSLDARSIPPSLVNASAGYYLQVVYKPTATGEHNARILIYDGGLPGTGIYVYLRGVCEEVPTLTPLTAYAPSNITPTSYTASWSEAPEPVDFYVVTRTRYLAGGVTLVEEIETEETSVDIEGFNDSDQETYSVQSSRLGFRSDPSNVQFVYHSSLQGIDAEEPLGARSCPGFILITCSKAHSDAEIIDTAGRVVLTLPTLEPFSELRLPQGVYLLRTRQHPTPLKIVAY